MGRSVEIIVAGEVFCILEASMSTLWVPMNPYIYVLTVLNFSEVPTNLFSFPLNYLCCQSLLKRFPDTAHSCWLSWEVPQFVGVTYLPPVLWLLEPGGAQGGAGQPRPDWTPFFS